MEVDVSDDPETIDRGSFRRSPRPRSATTPSVRPTRWSA